MSETKPDVKQKVKKQIEFYFSDSNLPYDKYLWNESRKDPQGWVSLEKIAGFKKMQWYTKDYNTVVEALKEQPSDLIEIDEEGKRVRRKTKVVEKKSVPCSIYAKGFPLVDEGAEDPVTAMFELQDEIEELFNQYGKVVCVRLRKHDEKPYKLKDSAYIEFETPEQAQEVAKKSIKYKDTELLLKTKKQYLDEKAEQYKDQPRQNKRKYQFNAFRSNKQPKFDNKNRKNKKPRWEENEEKKQEDKTAETTSNAATDKKEEEPAKQEA
ncbi:hypothetical protein VTP01DRAFT_2639 [Rhizomucor pusillus]|uniref:uncharacterized protein n=1 Tax=Rhizomucor pusillus TaxID=4840 RepID=UPI0037442CB6